MKQKDIVFVSRQAGTACSFIPVIKQLRQNDYRLHVLSYPSSEKTFADADVAIHSVNDFNDASRLLMALENLVLIITGTSYEVEDDHLYWDWGVKNKIKTAAYVDQWLMYERRFQLGAGMVFPQEVLVIDEHMKKFYLGLGLVEERLTVVGNPCLGMTLEKVSKNGRTDVVLFVSEPYGEAHPDSDWDELVALSQLKLCLEKNNQIRELIIRPHPIEPIRKYQEYVKRECSNTDIKIKISTASKYDDLSIAGTVIGIKSILILESYLVGRRCACLIPKGVEHNYYAGFSEDIAILHTSEDIDSFFKHTKIERVPVNLEEMSSTRNFKEYILSS